MNCILVPLGGVCSNDQFIFDVAVSATLTTREEVHGIRVRGKMVFLLSNCVVCFDQPNPTWNRSVSRAFLRVRLNLSTALQRAADWNQWTDQDTLIQMAGHLRGRALPEWTLLREAEKETLDDAVAALRGRLDPGSRALVIQDFRHAAQRENEAVADYMSRLEQLFRRVFRNEGMSDESRDTLLHRYEHIKAPAVSGSHTDHELCLGSSRRGLQ